MTYPLFTLHWLSSRDAYFHTIIETSAYADSRLVSEVTGLTDWQLVDLKHVDSAAHRRGTGVGNEQILNNIKALVDSSRKTRLVVRIPIVPGFNDSTENLQSTARFLTELRLTEVNLLPFHRIAESKYAQLGLEYAHADTRPPTGAEMAAHRQIFNDTGLDCYVGAETPL